jgi:hypothetical protein
METFPIELEVEGDRTIFDEVKAFFESDRKVYHCPYFDIKIEGDIVVSHRHMMSFYNVAILASIILNKPCVNNYTDSYKKGKPNFRINIVLGSIADRCVIYRRMFALFLPIEWKALSFAVNDGGDYIFNLGPTLVNTINKTTNNIVIQKLFTALLEEQWTLTGIEDKTLPLIYLQLH